MPAIPSDGRRRQRLSRTEWTLLAYAVLGGAVWTLLLFDGSMGGFVNGLLAFFAGGVVLAWIASRIEERDRDSAGDTAEPADRERPPRPPAALWTRRAAIVLLLTGIAGAVSAPGSYLWNDRTDLGIAFVAVTSMLAIGIAVVALVVADRRLLRAADAWRAQRRAERDPASTEPTRVGTPRSIRRDPDAPRASRLLGGQGRLARAIEKVLIVYLVVGFPLCAALFGKLALFAYPGFALALLAAQEASDRRVSRGMRGPANPKARRELQGRLASGRAWWAASPPPVLKGMRWAFGAFVGLGFYLCIVHPALEGADPAARYRATLPFVVGFLVGIGLLAFAERAQRGVELRWLEERRDERPGERRSP